MATFNLLSAATPCASVAPFDDHGRTQGCDGIASYSQDFAGSKLDMRHLA